MSNSRGIGFSTSTDLEGGESHQFKPNGVIQANGKLTVSPFLSP